MRRLAVSLAILSVLGAGLVLYLSGRDNTGPAAITGVVTYPQRIALPRDAVVKVQVTYSDVADAPSVVVGEQTIERPGQVPIRFRVPYKESDLDPKLRYVATAAIYSADGHLIFRSGQWMPVVTLGNPARDLTLEVVPIQSR